MGWNLCSTWLYHRNLGQFHTKWIHSQVWIPSVHSFRPKPVLWIWDFPTTLSAVGNKENIMSPQHPTCNGMVERFNKTLIPLIRSFIKVKHNTWDRNLRCLAAAYRATAIRVRGTLQTWWCWVGTIECLSIYCMEHPIPKVCHNQSMVNMCKTWKHTRENTPASPK